MYIAWKNNDNFSENINNKSENNINGVWPFCQQKQFHSIWQLLAIYNYWGLSRINNCLCLCVCVWSKTDSYVALGVLELPRLFKKHFPFYSNFSQISLTMFNNSFLRSYLMIHLCLSLSSPPSALSFPTFPQVSTPEPYTIYPTEFSPKLS